MVAESTGQTVRRVEVVAVLGGSAVLAGSWIIAAANHGVGGWEEDIFERVNDLPDFLWPVVWGPMQLGSLAGSLVVVAVTFATTRQKRLTLAALTASQTAFWSAKVIKGVVSRGRPAALLANVKLREKASGVGYVSGHTAVAFALAAVLHRRSPGLASRRRSRSVPFAGARCPRTCPSTSSAAPAWVADRHAVALGVRSRRRRPAGTVRRTSTTQPMVSPELSTS